MRSRRFAIAAISGKLVLALSLVFIPVHAVATPVSHAAPSASEDATDTPACDQSSVTLCTWTVEHDGIESDVPGCANEDGNVDGMPCLWFNDGKVWYVDSANYRQVTP